MKKILMIEDDADQLLLYRIPFEMEGFDIMTAATGQDGLAKAIGWKPDLILLDVMLDDTNGLDVLKQIKARNDLKTVKVVMLSNVSQKETVDQAKELGAAAFWQKTEVMPKMIMEKSKKLLGLDNAAAN